MVPVSLAALAGAERDGPPCSAAAREEAAEPGAVLRGKERCTHPYPEYGEGVAKAPALQPSTRSPAPAQSWRR